MGDTRRAAVQRRALAIAAALVALLGVVALVADEEPNVRVVQTRPLSEPVEEVATATTVVAVPPPPTPSTTSTTLPRRHGVHFPEEDAVATIWEGDLWLFGPTTGRLVQVTTDGISRLEAGPAFRDATHLTFISRARWDGPTMLEELDLTMGTHRVLANLPSRVLDYDWHDDGTLAYLSADPSVTHEVPHEVRMFTPATGRDVAVRSVGRVWGRGTFVNYDQLQIEWSPDGTQLLVVDTHVNNPGDQPLLVLRRDGSDVVPPRPGTWADWAPDSRTVYFLAEQATALDTSTGVASELVGIGPAARLRVSPNGRFLAYDDGTASPAVSVYELVTGTARVVGTSALAPVWWSGEVLLAGRTTPCVETEPHDDCMAGGHGSAWTDLGTGWHIDLLSSAMTPTALPSTEDVALKVAGTPLP